MAAPGELDHQGVHPDAHTVRIKTDAGSFTASMNPDGTVFVARGEIVHITDHMVVENLNPPPQEEQPIQ